MALSSARFAVTRRAPMPRANCPSCQLTQNFSQRSPVISGTPNGHDVALLQCDSCGFAVLGYLTRNDTQIVHHFPREVRCLNCDVALRH